MASQNNEKKQSVKMVVAFMFCIVITIVLIYPLNLCYQTYSYNQFVKTNPSVEAKLTKVTYLVGEQTVDLELNKIKEALKSDIVDCEYTVEYQYNVDRKDYYGSETGVGRDFLFEPTVYYLELNPEEEHFYVGEKSLLMPIVMAVAVLVFDLMILSIGMSIRSQKKHAQKFGAKYNNYVSKLNMDNSSDIRNFGENGDLYGIYNGVSSGSRNAGSVNDRYYNRFVSNESNIDNSKANNLNQNDNQNNVQNDVVTNENTNDNINQIGFFGDGDTTIEEYF